MSDKDVLDRARLLFVGDTQGDKLAREVIAIAEERAQTIGMLTPLKDAILFARAQRRPLGIGQDSEIGRPTVTIEVCPRYGREKHNPGFYLEADTLGPEDAEGPSATKRIAVALLRLAYEVAEKVRLQP